MSKSRDVGEFIKETKYTLARYEAVLAEFPDAKCTAYGEFISKSVNNQYTNLTFERRYGGLFVIPTCQIKFNYNDKEEIVKIHSSPRYSRLVYMSRWRRQTVDGKPVMKFSRLAINLKNNQFKDEMLSACGAEIMKFIGDNPGYHLDTKHLAPRLKKLLTFI
jgi:hypothetical protein